jgi:hypothetical protein
METYRNSYKKDEDYLLWELHEIRHKLHKARKNISLEEINREGFKIYSDWKKERNSRDKRKG